MDNKTLLVILYTILLVTPVTICQELVAKTKEKRQAIAGALQPLANYAGLAVPPQVYLALIAIYGIYAVVTRFRIRSNSDSHACANNRGWCRLYCFAHEYIDPWNSIICGANICCRPTEMN